MNPFFSGMNPGMNPMNGAMQLIQRIMQIKQDPTQLSNLLMQRGMINQQQAQDIARMGGNYEQIGQYLISNGKIPSNVQPYQGQVNEVQNLMQSHQN